MLTNRQILFGFIIYELAAMAYNKKVTLKRIDSLLEENRQLRSQAEVSELKSRLHLEELNIAYALLTHEEKVRVYKEFKNNEEFLLIARDNIA